MVELVKGHIFCWDYRHQPDVELWLLTYYPVRVLRFKGAPIFLLRNLTGKGEVLISA